ncbi:hypothetical protein [Hymenobacter rigui]|uniref:Uncharacterized protein n=1 Tax=Hymenobacter rigui TaxID=334424 RepID=A0A428KB85_9BACT|nr:hypothetical protein [Hymenobacter rigui]RSK43697.1 hypothetical protein EI291_21565 [Hymenobacter rigui]
MTLLSTETLAQAHRAVQRGEYFHTDETLLLGLPILEPFATLADTSFFSISSIKSVFPQEQPAIGSLLLTPEALYLKLGEQAEQLIVDGYTPLRLTIAEPEVTPLDTSLFPSRIQASNYIQAGSWHTYSFRLRHQREQQRLIQLLHCWYEQRIPLKESYEGQRTFLLNPTMSYEEIQAFKQRYGVTLYG